jgi:protein-S-isoprenylcysteine O-methyltransferase Ste14
MKDLRTPGRAVIAIGVILVALRWVIPAVSDIELGSTAGLLLSVGGGVIIFIGGAMLYWPHRPR